MDWGTVWHGVVTILAAIGATGTGVAVRNYRRTANADEEAEKVKPVWENGERKAVREALTLLGVSIEKYNERMIFLEAEREEVRRQQDAFDNRLHSLESRFRKWQAERAG